MHHFANLEVLPTHTSVFKFVWHRTLTETAVMRGFRQDVFYTLERPAPLVHWQSGNSERCLVTAYVERKKNFAVTRGLRHRT